MFLKAFHFSSFHRSTQILKRITKSFASSSSSSSSSSQSQSSPVFLDEQTTTIQSLNQEIRNEGGKEEAMEPLLDEEQRFIQNLNEEILQDTGYPLEDLINPSKVVNLKREILKLEKELQETNVEDLKNEPKRQEIVSKIEKKQETYRIESRAVMRSWLKNLFVIQSILAIAISLGMVTNSIPGYNLPLSVQVLGFWMWWLFIIPSLRARKPAAQEKEALNTAFLVNPLVTLLLPTFTKDTLLIWTANLITLGICYVYGFTKKPNDGQEKVETGVQQPDADGGSDLWIKAWKALDYGSGQERGARK